MTAMRLFPHFIFLVFHNISSSSSLDSRCVPWLGEGLSMPSPNFPVFYCPLPYRVAPVFVQVVSPPLGWSPLSYFLVIWSPNGDTRGPSVVFEVVDMPCPGPFHLSYSVDYIYDFCLIPDPDVALPILAEMLIILLSILACATPCLFCHRGHILLMVINNEQHYHYAQHIDDTKVDNDYNI